MSLPLTLVVLCSSLFVFTIANDYNSLITNGTCYFKAGEQMADEYSPCGNAALSNYWCCQLGDACASENACFNFGTGTTYLAGCTDSNYEDAVCPDKGIYSAQQWTGLVRCFVSDDHSKEEELWAACEDDEQPLVVTSNLSKSCRCDKNNSDFTTAVVFTAGPGLVNYATLPEQKGKSIMWAAGMTPSTFEFTETATSGSKSLSSRTSSSMITLSPSTLSGNLSSTSTPTPTSPNAIPTSNSAEAPATTSGLSKGATAGVVVGIIVGVLGLIALCSTFRRLPCVHKRGKSSDAMSEVWCYSGEGSQCVNKSGTTEPIPQYVSPYNKRSYTSDGHIGSKLPHGNAIASGILTNFDGSRSPAMEGRDNAVLVSPTSPRQARESSISARDGSLTSQQSPSSLIKTDGNMYQYQPYRPEYSGAQRQLHEIAELPACEKLLTENANSGGHHPAKNSDEGPQHFTFERDTIGTEKTTDLTELSPMRRSVADRHTVHELPG